MQSILAVIPARGGSKRVPRKNIRPFCGKPAIAYTIEAAQQSGIFDRIIVSTEDEEITAVALTYGAEVPFTRAMALADDHVHVYEVTLDALEQVDPDGTRFTYLCQLMSNCPLRTAEDIRDSYRQMRETDAEIQISMTSFGWFNPWWAMTIGEGYTLEPVFPEAFTKHSQDLPELYSTTGVIWWAKTEALRRYRKFHVPHRTGWVIPWQHAIDIDSKEDWEMAEMLYCYEQQHRKP